MYDAIMLLPRKIIEMFLILRWVNISNWKYILQAGSANT